MKLFISWSQSESKAVATEFRNWVKQVLQNVDPFMSDRDISSGARWSQSIATNLNHSKAGIIFVTPQNVSAPWLHFEAGALSKTVEDAFVCPLLFRVEPASLVGPMAQFQAKRYGKQGVFDILQTIRSHPNCSSSVKDADFVDAFEVWWPKLEAKISEAESAVEPNAITRSDSEILSETLELVRALVRETRGSTASTASSKFEELRLLLSDGRSGDIQLKPEVRTKTPHELIKSLIKWDQTLITLLGGETSLREVIDALLGGHIGNAVGKVMTLTGYDLPHARTFIDSLQVAINRLSEKI